MYIPDRFLSPTKDGIYQNNQDHIISQQQQQNNRNIQIIQNQEQNHLQFGSDNAFMSPIKHSNNLYTYEQNFKPIMQGYINKKTLNTTYQPRYFMLTPTRLLYFTDQSKRQLKGCFNIVSLLKHNLTIDFVNLQIRIKVSPPSHQTEFQNRFIIQLQFPDNPSIFVWFYQLNSVLKKLKEKYLIDQEKLTSFYPVISIDNLLSMNQKIASQYNHNFWNKLNISLKQLNTYSSHLDILLLRSKNPVSYLSRFFMRSYYDHVALILKSQLHQIFVFQAIQSRGVCIMDLETFLKVSKQIYEEIGYRKLIIQQSQEQQKEGLYKGVNLSRLQTYLNSLLGKKYQLSISKLLVDPSECTSSKQSVIGSQNSIKIFHRQISSNNKIDQVKQSVQGNIEDKKQRTFFCSELIADIYLKFGIVTQGKSKDFWPKDFQQNQINFKQKASFSPIMNVCME